MTRLLISSGKTWLHGRTPENPSGCAGGYQRPARVTATGERRDGGTVVGFRPGDDAPSAQGDPGPEAQQ